MKKWTNITVAGAILSSITFPLQADAMESKTTLSRPQYQIEAVLHPQQHSIDASETVTFKNTYSQHLNDLVFHLYPDSYNQMETMSNMQVKPDPDQIAEEIKQNPTLKEEDFFGDIEVKHVTIQGEKVAYTQEKQVLKIQLDQLIQRNQHVEVKIDFKVKIPYGGQRLNYRDNFYSITKWYPILAMYDSKQKKWDEKPYHPDGESDYSEFSDYKMKLKVPKEMVVAATGIEKESIQHNKKIVQVDAPNVREFAFFASPHYQKETRKVAGISVNSYFDKRNPKSRKIALQGLDSVEKAMPFFNKKFGHYAYPEFDIMETRIVGAAMEYPTIVQMGEYLEEYVNAPLVHELAHQWFYGMVGNDPYYDPALDECFADFAHKYFMKYDTKGEYDFKNDELITEEVIKSPGAINRPLDQYPYGEYGKYIYMKGPIALVDLYDKVGEPKFDQIMRIYFAKNKFTNATFSNFFEAVNQVAGKEIENYMRKAFFDPDYYPTHLRTRLESMI
ncbi:hypothetical protein BM86_23920 [Bacillus thuringiensis]|uniref:Peptidase M1 membrane alanine aminopeptidase domain-containing protein n=1 Tax=Bacillus thuringiensis TaxID=1428 RepID=A0A9W3X3X1_BACTU|nr:M1 family metallopeptidase [Bacillus thuringiensis]ANS51765.1 hypothetical protein BT246_64730 [Bacillus thuringiensis]MBH0338451.1 hypothetical protein [Bacillus thuringiensis]